MEGFGVPNKVLGDDLSLFEVAFARLSPELTTMVSEVGLDPCSFFGSSIIETFGGRLGQPLNVFVLFEGCDTFSGLVLAAF